MTDSRHRRHHPDPFGQGQARRRAVGRPPGRATREVAAGAGRANRARPRDGRRRHRRLRQADQRAVAQHRADRGARGRFAETVPATTVDRQCGSSQQAAHFAAQGVLAGAYDIVVAGGVESMSRVPMLSSLLGANAYGPARPRAVTPMGLVTQGVSAELIAARWGFSGRALDEFSARSHRLAAADRRRRRLRRTRSCRYRSSSTRRRPSTYATRPSGPRRRLTVWPRSASFASPEMHERFQQLDWRITPATPRRSPTARRPSSSWARTRHSARPAAPRPVPFVRGGRDDPLLMLTGLDPGYRPGAAEATCTIDDIDAYEVNEAFAPVPLAWTPELRRSRAAQPARWRDRPRPSARRIRNELLTTLVTTSKRPAVGTACRRCAKVAGWRTRRLSSGSNQRRSNPKVNHHSGIERSRLTPPPTHWVAAQPGNSCRPAEPDRRPMPAVRGLEPGKRAALIVNEMQNAIANPAHVGTAARRPGDRARPRRQDQHPDGGVPRGGRAGDLLHDRRPHRRLRRVPGQLRPRGPASRRDGQAGGGHRRRRHPRRPGGRAVRHHQPPVARHGPVHRHQPDAILRGYGNRNGSAERRLHQHRPAGGGDRGPSSVGLDALLAEAWIVRSRHRRPTPCRSPSTPSLPMLISDREVGHGLAGGKRRLPARRLSPTARYRAWHGLPGHSKWVELYI